MLTFAKWMLHRESSPATRARSAAALGLLPPQVVGSLNGHSTAAPWEAEHLGKIARKHRKGRKGKFGASRSKKKITPVNKNTQIDRWLQEVGDLKDDLAKLKSIFDKKKSAPQAAAAKKPPQPADDDKGEKNKKPPKAKEDADRREKAKGEVERPVGKKPPKES